MGDMNRIRRWPAAAAVALAAVAFPAAAYATWKELGATSSPLVAPVCPTGVSSSNCTIILTRVTAVETIRDGVDYPTTVTKAGRITAFTIGLSQLSTSKSTQKSYIHYLDSTYGGTTRVALTVLRSAGGKKSDFAWNVVAESPIYHVEPYLGSVVQIPLESSIEVKPGDVIALTTPTWAPVLSIDLDTKKFAYRQSRSGNCSSPPATDQAQLASGQSAQYQCDYPGTRLEYSATEVYYPNGTDPVH